MSISPDSFFSSIPAPAESFLRRRAPLPKVCFTILFLVLTVSFSKYALAGTVLFAAVPFLLAAAAKLPVTVLLFRIIPALPFIFCTGIANLFFDHTPVHVFSFELSGGTVSLLVLIAKTLASVGMVLLLSSTTAFRDLAGALRCLHVPCLLILVLQQLFRYLALLAREAGNMRNACFMRNPECRIIPLREWGNLAGRLFIKSTVHADAVYAAMQCRLFHAGKPLPARGKGSPLEWCIVILLSVLLCFLRRIL